MRVSIVGRSRFWTSTTARGASRSTTFLRNLGCLHCSIARKRSRRLLPEMGQRPHGVAGFISERPWLRPLRARPSCVEPLVRPPQAPATSAAPSRSAVSSEPRGSLAGRDIWPRETEYRAIPKAGTEAHHATERAAPTIFRSQRTAYAPNICRSSLAVHRCRRLPSSQ